MKTATLREWTFTKLNKAFGLSQILATESTVLQTWQARAKTIERWREH